MLAEFKETTRGREMIFVRVVLTEDANSPALDADARTQTGLSVPAMLVDAGIPGERVLVVPRLDVDVIATVSDGGRTDSITINPKRAKRQSQLNTPTKNVDAERVRNVDAKVRRSSGRVYPTDVVPDWTAGRLRREKLCKRPAPALPMLTPAQGFSVNAFVA